jgi:tetratricopeptide (TPR) repeat protein
MGPFILQSLSQTSPAYKVDSLKLESLKNRLSSLKGKDRVDLLNEIAARMNFVIAKSKRKDSITFYAQKAFDEATKIEYKAGSAMALLNLSYETIQNPPDSVKALNEKKIRAGIQIGEELNNNEILGYGYYLLTGLPSIARSFEKVAEYYKLSSEYCLKAGDTLRAAEVTNWLFDIYFYRGHYEEAFEIGKKAVSLSQKINTKDISRSWQQNLVQYSLSNMSSLYSAAGDYESAMVYLKNDNEYALINKTGWILNGEIANLFCDMGKYDSALLYWNRWRYSPYFDTYANGHKLWGFRIRASIHLGKKEYDAAIDTFTSNIGLMNIQFGFTPPDAPSFFAEAYYGKKEFTKALHYARAGLVKQKEKEVRPQLLKSYQLLSDIFHQLENNDSAYHYLVKYNTLKDSIQNRQFLLRIYNSKKEAEYERNSSQLNLLNKDNQLKEQKLKQQAFIKNGLIIGFFLTILLSVFVIRNLTLKRKNEKLKQEQAEKEWAFQKLESEKKQAELHHRAAELEMQALRAQMNPHFIFNCLSSINRIIMKNDSQSASDYLTRFSRLMRMVLINSQRSMIPLEDELQMLRLYLDMERLRFKDSFTYSVIFTNTIDEGAVFVPPLLLQPFCENAIWHGLMQKDGQGHLNIELSMDNKLLQCTISDNGIGREAAEKLKSKSAGSQKSMGLQITAQRLALLNQDKNIETFYSIEDIRDADNNIAGTRVILKIDYKELVEEIV